MVAPCFALRCVPNITPYSAKKISASNPNFADALNNGMVRATRPLRRAADPAACHSTCKNSQLVRSCTTVHNSMGQSPPDMPMAYSIGEGGHFQAVSTTVAHRPPFAVHLSPLLLMSLYSRTSPIS